MVTRHEQVQAHRFITRRIVSALLSGEPETSERPMRRLALALFASIIVAAIVFAVVGIYGFLNPSGGKPVDGNLVIMRETGARFAVVDGTLHPVLNWSSALLFVGAAKPTVKQMSRKSLATLPVGDPIGIPGAPDPPPARSALLGPPWTLCSVPGIQGSDQPTTHLLVGRAPAGEALPAETPYLVALADNERFLLWQDRLHRISSQAALIALDLSGAPVIRVAPQFVNGITRGPDLAPPAIPDIGKPTDRRIAGVPGVLGKIYRSGQSYYVLTANGLAPIGEVSARLLLASGGTPTDITAAEAANNATRPIEDETFPKTVPRVTVGPAALAMLCAVFRNELGDGKLTTVYGVRAAGAESLAIAPTQARVGADGVASVDRVLVPHGRGAVVRAQPAPGSNGVGVVYVVTDLGVRVSGAQHRQGRRVAGSRIRRLRARAGAGGAAVPRPIGACSRPRRGRTVLSTGGRDPGANTDSDGAAAVLRAAAESDGLRVVDAMTHGRYSG